MCLANNKSTNDEERLSPTSSINGDCKEPDYRNAFLQFKMINKEDNSDIIEENIFFEGISNGNKIYVTLAVQDEITDKTPDLLSIMRNDYFESNRVPESEKYLNSLKDHYSNSDIMLWLNKIMNDNLENPHILCGLLHIISHYPYSYVQPTGPTMACLLLNHIDNSVKDFAIKAFENWNKKETITYLKNIELTAWLREYAEGVIEDLKMFGDD